MLPVGLMVRNDHDLHVACHDPRRISVPEATTPKMCRGKDLSSMKAAVVHKLGNTPRCDEFPEPVAGEDEVVVDVLAASLKPVDKQMASGSHYAAPRKFPFICGTDG